MGGLVLHRVLTQYSPAPLEAEDRLGRVVMLAPPFGGSEVADTLAALPPYRWIYGPAGQDLTTAARQGSTQIISYDLGIIAGTRGWPYFISAHLFDGPHDGRVSVESTKEVEYTDHITLPATHTFIMERRDVHEQIVHFLENGEFGSRPD
mgnify:CR=1 FL=1